jgi:hypothetical protein
MTIERRLKEDPSEPTLHEGVEGHQEGIVVSEVGDERSSLALLSLFVRDMLQADTCLSFLMETSSHHPAR